MKKERNFSESAEVDKEEIERCRLLVNKIIKVQGKIFIKELLRSKKSEYPDIRLGIAKEA